MTRALVTVLACMLLVGAGRGDEERAKHATYADPTYGFRMAVPQFVAPFANLPAQVAFFGGGTRDRFWSNVGVIVQKTHTTLDQYRKQNDAELKKAKAKIIAARVTTVSGRPAVEYDYEQTMQTGLLRFLQLVVIDKEQVLTFTCTARADAFPSLAAEFEASLKSIALD